MCADSCGSTGEGIHALSMREQATHYNKVVLVAGEGGG